MSTFLDSSQKSGGGSYPALNIKLPDWVAAYAPPPDYVYETLEERVELAIGLARRNIELGTGGPFGAAIFNLETKQLVAPGVNIVVPAKWSGGHAEMVAFAIAQQAHQTHDLGGQDLPAHELVASTEPCSMCFGATPWSGVKRLVYGASVADARAVGFDEGPKPENWIATLEARGIEVVKELLRDDAAAVLRSYADAGGHVYNGRSQ